MAISLTKPSKYAIVPTRATRNINWFSPAETRVRPSGRCFPDKRTKTQKVRQETTTNLAW